MAAGGSLVPGEGTKVGSHCCGIGRLPGCREVRGGCNEEEVPGAGGEGGLTANGIDLPVERGAGVVGAGLQHGGHGLPGGLLQREAPGLGG